MVLRALLPCTDVYDADESAPLLLSHGRCDLNFKKTTLRVATSARKYDKKKKKKKKRHLLYVLSFSRLTLAFIPISLVYEIYGFAYVNFMNHFFFIFSFQSL